MFEEHKRDLRREFRRRIRETYRQIRPPQVDEPLLGPLAKLPGTWRSEGSGWNMIALPQEGAPFGFRLLVNQYDETLEFVSVDDRVPNRGVKRSDPDPDDPDPNPDQFLVALDYQQKIHQVAAADFPPSIDIAGEDLAGGAGLAIHHEPGLFLNMIDELTSDIDIARLATIPHGNSVLALGRSQVLEGEEAAKFKAPAVNGLPIGVRQTLNPVDPDNPRYLDPYSHFDATPFMGNVQDSPDDFPGFNPATPHVLLDFANKDVTINRITELILDTEIESGGIVNIPFIERQADAASMKSTFWIQELNNGSLRLQYLQVVILDFFRRFDGLPGLIRWPHVSINTLDKAPD